MSDRDREAMKAFMSEIFCQLESRPHATLPGLRQRYYYRGKFPLLEYLTPKAVAWNVARLRRVGEYDHAAALDVWSAADGGESRLRRKRRQQRR